ncbi:hypothetical protein ml_239 [Mollivirus sibericum]|uniref:hypothetical protein n=1 Tax=Mollivirus sibericum TaxID=1678078 RepID=UPI0006B2DEEA|nr:hypothetical protein ml_239 [Mollivirus sibericum]ALD62041.1 hypothetical protein ml_239 [Mollivirus sibericum]
MSKIYIIGTVPTGDLGISDDHRALRDTHGAIQARRRKLIQRRKIHKAGIDGKSCARLAVLCAWMARSGKGQVFVCEELLPLLLEDIVAQIGDFVAQSQHPAEALVHLKRVSLASQDRGRPHDIALALLHYVMCGQRVRNGATGETVEPLLPFRVVIDDVRGILSRAHEAFVNSCL